MASGPKRSKRSGGTARKAAPVNSDPRERVVDAFMALLAEHRFGEVGLADIAERAGVSLADLRGLHDGKLSIFADFARRIDRKVLEAGVVEASAEESARDRLFDVIMRRFDALAPYKDAVRRVAAAARCDPGLACALHAVALGSQKWTLAAAGIHKRGALRLIATEGTLLVYAEAMRTWLDDDSADLGPTMATLDRSLRRGESVMRFAGKVCCALPRMAGRFRRPHRAGEAAA